MLHQLQVPAADADQRLDVWLEAHLDGCSRSLLARCIKSGLCTITPGKAKTGYRLRGGECISIEVPEIEPIEAVAEDIPLDVLFEDDELIVVNKAPGMVVHPAIGHLRGTLINAILGRYGVSGGEAFRPGLIHRLDADTSGVVCIARTAAAHAWYQDQFRARAVKKCYLAIVAGLPRADVLNCDAALGRSPKDFRRRAVLPDDHAHAKAAHTTFVARQRHETYTVCEARPTTGRTHQIRVHAAHLGHPILADAVYGRSPVYPPTGAPLLSRQALHAWTLALPRPDGEVLRVQAPIPDDIQVLLTGDLTPMQTH